MNDLRLERDGGVATLLIDRPQARNALARQTMRELDEALGSIASSGAHVLVIRGAGDLAFCAGGDLKELERMRSESEAAEMAREMRATLDRIPQLPIPVIAALNGDAFGGGAELAVACDFRVGAARARISFTQVTLGLMPAWGAPERLAALVGRGRALFMLLGGDVMSAAQAMQLGLVEDVYADESFDDQVRELAQKISAAPAPALAGIKASVNAVRPHHDPKLARTAIAAFAKTWADPAHWDALEEMERRRRSK
jgi:enoyl-CoA hydratase/carnithine racemase